MRILFYLPVATPWWFRRILAPLIRAASRGAEVHVMVPPLWQNTGVTPSEIALLGDLDQIRWHILSDPAHPRLRTPSPDNAVIADLVRAIAPDYTLCRSADLATPALFPGIVRHVMEGAAPPFATSDETVQLNATPFELGILPDLTGAQAERLDAAFAPLWQAARTAIATRDDAAFRRDARLPARGQIVALPLEYEHPEMFFRLHDRYPGNAALLRMLVPLLGTDMTLAATHHPLSVRNVDLIPLTAWIEAQQGRVRIVKPDPQFGAATMRLIAHADAAIVGNSKCGTAMAFHGVPTARLSRFRSAPWMRHYPTAEALIAALAAGRAEAPSERDTRRWFAHHLFDTAFDATDPALDAAALAARMTVPHDPARWPRRIAELARSAPAPAPAPATATATA